MYRFIKSYHSREHQFASEQERDAFKRVFAAIHVVSKEQEAFRVGARRSGRTFQRSEESMQILVLAMDVSDDHHRRPDFQQSRFARDQLLRVTHKLQELRYFVFDLKE